MRRLLIVAMAALCATPALSADPAQLLLLSTFHFKDAGLDAVKVKDFDVMAPAPQAYLEALTDRLAAFNPTHVMLEYTPEEDEEVNGLYHQFIAGEHQLASNEVEQLGFRIAKKAKLERLEGFDHRDVQWGFGAAAEYAEKNNATEFETLKRLIANFETEESEVRKNSTLQGLLLRQNDPEMERRNRDFYLVTNTIGVDDGWTGADAAASWWQRNFRMYALLQRTAQPGTRVIAIGGTGHMAIIKSLADTDGRIA